MRQRKDRDSDNKPDPESSLEVFGIVAGMRPVAAMMRMGLFGVLRMAGMMVMPFV